MIYNITIGSSLQALQFAYQNDTKLILNELQFPDVFEASYIKNTWGLLYTKLMLDGKVVGGDTVKNIRITDIHLQIVCDYNIVNQVEYNKLHIFSDKNIIGLPDAIEEVDQYKVIDILRVKSLIAPCEHRVIETNEPLVRELHIIKDGPSIPTEVYSISFLTKEQLLDFDFSDTMVKFKSEHMLEESGLLGKVLNTNCRAPIELETVERIIHKEMDRYDETENIKFIYGN